jgi:hypothetical protein
MYVKLNIEARSRNHCCRGKVMSVTYCECVCVSVVVVVQHAERLLRGIVPFAACPAVPNFSTLFLKRHDFG